MYLFDIDKAKSVLGLKNGKLAKHRIVNFDMMSYTSRNVDAPKFEAGFKTILTFYFRGQLFSNDFTPSQDLTQNMHIEYDQYKRAEQENFLKDFLNKYFYTDGNFLPPDVLYFAFNDLSAYTIKPIDKRFALLLQHIFPLPKDIIDQIHKKPRIRVLASLLKGAGFVGVQDVTPWYNPYPELTEQFQNDTRRLFEDQKMFLNYFPALLIYYTFRYFKKFMLMDKRLSLTDTEAEKIDSYFAFETEKLSSDRKCISGFRTLMAKKRDWLGWLYLIDMLNYTKGESVEKPFWSIRDIIDRCNDCAPIELIRFVEEYASVEAFKAHTTLPKPDTTLTELIETLLGNLIKVNNRDATSNHLSGGIETFVSKFCTKSFGPLGRVLILNKELLMAWIGVVIPKGEKMSKNIFFQELKARGMHTDSSTQTQILIYLDRLKLVSKKNDSSSENQYIHHYNY